jgi:hypothetical protein
MPRLLLLIPTLTYRAEAFLDAVGREGASVTIATDRALVFTSRDPVGMIALPFDDSERAATAVAEFADAHPIDAVLGVDDETVVLSTAIAERLGLPHNPPDAVHAAKHKGVQRERLRAAGVRSPEFSRHAAAADPRAIAAIMPYPCVIKPVALSASRGVIRADDPQAFVAAFERVRAIVLAAGGAPESHELVVERFVPGVEVALEGLIEDGRLRALAVFDKPDPLDGPTFEESIYVTPSRLPEARLREVEDCASCAARALGLVRGPVHAELRVNASGVWLIELAARSIGGLCSLALRFDGDTTLEALIVRQALGGETRGVERERRASGVLMLPIPGDGVLAEVAGRDDAARVPDVERVAIVAHRGQRMVAPPEGARYPGFVFARADTPGAVERALREAGRRIRFVLESPAGVDTR